MILSVLVAFSLILTATSDKPAYNLGESVQIRAEVRNHGSQAAGPATVEAIVRFAGAGEITRKKLPEVPSLAAGASLQTGPVELWRIPENARLGLYEIEVRAGDQAVDIPRGIVVYRQEIAIDLLRTDQNLYTVGETVRARARIKNLTSRRWSGLQLVLGRGYPWISGFGRGSAISGAPPAQVYTYPEPVNLGPGQVFETDWFDTMTSTIPDPKKPDIFNMFCWISDASGQELYELEQTGTFIVRPFQYEGPLPYHPYYALYRFLDQTDYKGTSYRNLEEYSDRLPVKAPQISPWMGFAPHFDDEMAYLSLVPLSRRAGVPFHIVNMTSGDGNVESIHRYVDGISNPADWHTLGYLRYHETRQAYNIFGVKDEEVSYLGLPDGGLLSIFQDTRSENFYMFTTGTDRTPYDYAYRKNLAYHREAITQTLMELIRKHKPQDIYTPHPDEGHGDHRTTTFFVLEALQRLRQEDGYEPRVHVYVSYGAGDFPRARYRYEPEGAFPVSDRTLIKLHFASWAYQSQFSIGERGGIRLSLEELRKHPQRQWYRLLGW